MLLWLNGTSNNRWDVNENYARELQELFCLGAGRGYSERDVRQLARALTGFRNDWTDAGPTRFRFDKKFHDRGAKRIYGRRGKYTLAGGRAAGHAPPPPPRVHGHEAVGLLHPDQAARGDDEDAGAAVRRRATATCARCSRRSSPTPTSTTPRKRMVKPPVVQAAGMLRAVGRGIDTPAWAWLCESAGQYLFMPPNVSGWDDTRWLDTATFRARWQMAQHICEPGAARPREGRHGAVRSRRAGPPRGRVLGLADALRARARRPRALRRRHARRRRQALEARELPRAGAERAADARRHLPRLPDELMHEHLLHRTRPRLRRPPRDRARHARARRHRPLAPLVPAALRRPRARRLRRRAGSRSCPRSRPASRTPRPRRPGTVLLSVFLDGGVDTL